MGSRRASATLASQVALSCYQAAGQSAGHDPRKIVAATEAAFDQLLHLDSQK